MRRRVLAASLLLVTAALTACSDTTIPTRPMLGGASGLNATIGVDGCVDRTLTYASVNAEVTGLIQSLFTDLNHRSSTQTMWDNLKKDKLDSRPLQNHIDNLTGWTLDHLGAGALRDPDAAGLLNATTGAVRLLDLVFRCTGTIPTNVPTPPPGFDAVFQLVQPSETDNQQFNTSLNDAGAFVPGGSLETSTLLVLVRQPDEVNVNTPFPKRSHTVDVALAGGKLREGRRMSVLFCPFEDVPDDENPRLVVAHQLSAVAPGAPVGAGVEYLPPPEGGQLDCPHGLAASVREEKNLLKRSAMQVALLAQKAWSYVGPKPLYAGHAAIGGSIGGFLSPLVVVDPYVETGIFDVAIPTTTYGETIAFTALLKVTNVPAACGLPTSPAVCSWVGQAVTQSLPGMPPLSALNISATLDGQTQSSAIDGTGTAQFSFTGINAGDDQTANLSFARTLNLPANAPDFGASSATAQFTVNRRPLAAAATANEWTYGTPEPVTGTFTSAAVQYGENVTATFTTTLGATTDVGTYPDALVADVAFGPGVRAANYLVTETNATLTIVRAPLSISANDRSRPYGQDNGSFSYPADGTIAGIKNNDAISLTFTTHATPSSHVGTYPIVPTAVGDRLFNYFINSTHNGTLTVTSAPLDLFINEAQKVSYRMSGR